ncbi:hypothetical protein [Sporosarcina sp. Marseille-Q4063]|uniref:hypothetical protein n=1 Tax=Sporosarcina sp. Marseille-Q4063 TaxID=2810514 RepID=UPI00353024E6
MVNRDSEDFGAEQWYPRLPDGFDGQDMFEQGSYGFSPGYGMPGYSMGQGGYGYEMPGYPYGQGMTGFSQGQGRPGFPPGQGFPGFPPGQGFPGFPPGQGGPGFPPGQGRPDFPPGQQQGRSQPPRSAPPSTTPEYPSTQLFAVDPGAIRGCLYRFTFVWLSRRRGFWFFPDFVGRRSVAGWRWRSRQRRWEYTGIDLDNIDRFTCF